MERRTAIFFLSDGKEYEFAERNREDINYTQLQNKFRASRIRQIQDVHKDDKEFCQYLIIQEWGRMYYEQEVWRFILDDPEEKIKLVFASFKICNPDVSIDDFRKLVTPKIIDDLLKGIGDLEQDEPALDEEVIKELKIKKEILLKWKEEHPEIYYAVKQNLKKKTEQKLAKK